MPSGEASCRVGVDDNGLRADLRAGLGARLGPLAVTAVQADVTAAVQRLFTRPLRGKIHQDLGDSKRLVSHSDVTLWEAWARVLTGDSWATPQALSEHLSRESSSSLRKYCPSHVEAQCWGGHGEAFASSHEVRDRRRGHVATLMPASVECFERARDTAS